MSVASITSSSQFEGLNGLEKERLFGRKVGLDFAYAFDDCYVSSSAPYIAILEGDVLVADGWFARVLMGLKEIAHHSEPMAGSTAVQRGAVHWMGIPRYIREQRAVDHNWNLGCFAGHGIPPSATYRVQVSFDSDTGSHMLTHDPDHSDLVVLIWKSFNTPTQTWCNRSKLGLLHAGPYVATRTGSGPSCRIPK